MFLLPPYLLSSPLCSSSLLALLAASFCLSVSLSLLPLSLPLFPFPSLSFSPSPSLFLLSYLLLPPTFPTYLSISCCLRLALSLPISIPNAPNCSLSQRRHPCTPEEREVCLLVLTADGYLKVLNADTGTVLKSVFLSTVIKFR